MVAFEKIRRMAERRVGKAALTERMPKVKAPSALKKLSDDRYLSLMALRIFRAGLKHSLVDAKWPAFEEAFGGFDPRLVRAMSDEEVEDLMKDPRLIRHLGKLKAVHANAAAVCRIAEEHGKFGAYIAGWPGDKVTALWDDLAKRFEQMGGNSAPYFLRMAGKDTFMLTPAVVKALNEWGAFEGQPKSKTDRAKVQVVFNHWAAETDMPLSHLSMTLAASVD